MGTGRINGARIVLETLYRLGVRDIFGYPGGAVIPIYDEIYSFPEINHYFARHEQGAVHEADGYARATAKVGVCIATSGPGATNLVTGIMTAHMDSVPLLAITGQVASSLLGKDAFQESDIVGITLPITKNNYLVKDIRLLPRIIREAYYLASTGRPGPVLIDIPKNIQCEFITMEEYEKIFEEEIRIEGYAPNYRGHLAQIKKAMELLQKAKRPLIIAGAGILKAKAYEELKTLAESLEIPVTNTLLGLGSFPGDHPLALGMLGMHGTATANFATTEADVVLAVGIRFDDRICGKPQEFCKNAKIIHVDIDPAEIEKNKLVDIPIVGDLHYVLTEMNKLVKEAQTHAEWLAQIKAWQEEYPIGYRSGDELMAQEVLSVLNELLKGEAVVVTDVGQHQMWAAQFLTYKYPHSIITSGGAGTMGFGLPAVIGAQVGKPEAKVVLIVGDGGFQMTAHELMLLTQYKLPVKVIILNNSYLGMVRQWQELFYDQRYSYVDLSYNPDFVQLARAYDVKGVRISERRDLKARLKEVLDAPEGVVVDCVVKKEANVYPMIPAGGTVADMVGLKGGLPDE